MSNKKLWTSAIVVAIAAIANHAQASIVVPAADTGDLTIFSVLGGAGAQFGEGTTLLRSERYSGVPLNLSFSETGNNFAALGTTVGTTAVAANLATPDSGTVSFDYQALLAVTGPGADRSFDPALADLSARFSYYFTPNIDSFFNMNWVIDESSQFNSATASLSTNGGLLLTNLDSGQLVREDTAGRATGTYTTQLAAGNRYLLTLSFADYFSAVGGSNVLTGHQAYDFTITDRPTTTTVPEPAAASLLLVGLTLAGLRRRKRQPNQLRGPAHRARERGFATVTEA